MSDGEVISVSYGTVIKIFDKKNNNVIHRCVTVRTDISKNKIEFDDLNNNYSNFYVGQRVACLTIRYASRVPFNKEDANATLIESCGFFLEYILCDEKAYKDLVGRSKTK